MERRPRHTEINGLVKADELGSEALTTADEQPRTVIDDGLHGIIRKPCRAIHPCIATISRHPYFAASKCSAKDGDDCVGIARINRNSLAGYRLCEWWCAIDPCNATVGRANDVLRLKAQGILNPRPQRRRIRWI
ncbi:MAG: hypothetical protein DME53_13110 [Verrucomicrobia bacterium]|nr:MAG: hypothetical protein DME53_13110 [Verrucomicrobiota bacterium]